MGAANPWVLAMVLKGFHFQWSPHVSGNWELGSSLREQNSLSAELNKGAIRMVPVFCRPVPDPRVLNGHLRKDTFQMLTRSVLSLSICPGDDLVCINRPTGFQVGTWSLCLDCLHYL